MAFEGFSSTETKILEMLFQLKSQKEMAEALHVSVRTIKFHTSNIYRKLGIDTGVGTNKLILMLRKLGTFEISVRWTPKKLEIFDDLEPPLRNPNLSHRRRAYMQ